MKSRNKGGSAHSSQRDNLNAKGADAMQSPPEALLPLLPYLPPAWTIWEPACGKGNLVRALKASGRMAFGTDIDGAHYGAKQGVDFLGELGKLPGTGSYHAIVTNPPYSRKDAFLARCYELGKPFALLLPLTALEGRRRQALYRKHGVEIVLLDRRLNFETPSGKQSGSWFSTAWFTWGMGIGRELTFYQFPPKERSGK